MQMFLNRTRTSKNLPEISSWKRCKRLCPKEFTESINHIVIFFFNFFQVNFFKQDLTFFVLLDGEQLTNEELNSLLIHAHKRVLQLQKQIEKMQLTQNQQIQAALSEQQRQNSELQKQNEANLYSLHRKEFELEKDKTVIDL